MIRIYGMSSCPDCQYVEEQVKGNNRYEVIDIGRHVRDLKAFLKLRDHEPVFAEAKQYGAAGIPCLYSKTVRSPLHQKKPGCVLAPLKTVQVAALTVADAEIRGA